MTPERWQEVKNLLAAALERPPRDRTAYLDQACSEPALRREVESLLAAHNRADDSVPGFATGDGEPLKPGDKIGPYEIVACIGAGGMGVVFRAHDPRLKRDVAVKVLPSSLSADPDRLDRFEQEARAAAALNHPNILAVFQMGIHEGAPYLVSELLEGRTLREELTRGPIQLRKVIDCGVQVARGLAAAHQKGILHRDLKPENLFVTKDGRVKILDFGLAKLTQLAGGVNSFGATVNGITESGVVMGTVGYMSPEQVRGEALDVRTDIFAFGATLYELLTAKRAFQKPTAVETLNAILNEEPQAIAQLAPATPFALDKVVRRCLEKDPGHRFHSAWDLAFALEALSDSGGAPKPAPANQVKAFDSVAVLPLQNATSDPQTEYLSDGIAETLINTLAQLRKIRVVPRTLAFRYRGSTVDPLAAGRELGVRTVLVGRMTQRGDDLTVSVELVDVERQAQLWGGRYNRKMTDLVALQEELTTEISQKLKLQLTGEEKRRLRRRPTQNNEAYRLLLQARHHAGRMSREAVLQAIALCQEAVDLDPTYPAAYSLLSSLYGNQALLGYASSAEVYPRMKAAAERAIELDETLAAAHVSLALVLFNQSWDFLGAEREIERSLELNQNLPEAHNALALLNVSRGHFEEAIAAAKRAVELDPLLPPRLLTLGLVYYCASRFEEAIEQIQRGLELQPGNALGHVLLADAYAYAGKPEKAIEQCEKALALGPGVEMVRLNAAATYIKAGRVEEGRNIAEEIERKWKPSVPVSHLLASVHARLGEKDAAFAWLEKAFQEHAAFLRYLKVHPLFNGLRDDQRFDAIVKRMGIPD